MCHSKKHFVMCALVCLLACSCAWAFPGRGEAAAEEEKISPAPAIPADIPEEVSLPEVPEMTEVEIVVEPPVQQEVQPVLSSEVISQIESMILSATQNDSKKESKLNSEELNALIESLRTIQAEYAIVAHDAEVKEQQLADLAALNAEQADELAYLRGAYDTLVAEDKPPLFMPDLNAGVIMGFNNQLPEFGVTASLGIKHRSGFKFSVGASYMIGTLDEIYMPALDNCLFSASLGWQW